MSTQKPEENEEQQQSVDDNVLDYDEDIEELEEEEESYYSGSYDMDGEEGEEEYMDDEEQENPLFFKTFPLEELRGQHIMAVATSNRFVLFGTNRGVVALVEITGMVFRILNNHTDPISDVSCDVMEEHVGSSDKTGLVTLQNLYDEHDFYRKEFDVPIQSMALHPKYGRNEERPVVVCGGDKVILISKTRFLGHRKISILQERRGKVYAVRWCGSDVIAWANDRGVQLYSYTARAMVQLVPRPSDSPRFELYRCSLVWEAPNALICGWGDWVQVLHVHELRMEERLRWGTEFMSRTHRVDVMPSIQTLKLREPCQICGIAPFGPDRYFLLACTVGHDGHMKELEVRIVERSTFFDVYRGRLNTKYKHPLQFSLAFSGSDARTTAAVTSQTATGTTKPLLSLESEDLSNFAYFIVCVDAVIKATPTDDDHHVEYLLKKSRFEEAYKYARTYPLRRLQLADIGRSLQQHLFMEGRYEELASRIKEFVMDDYMEWERWICQFDQQGVSDLLVDILPTWTEDNTTDKNDNGDGQQDRKKTRIAEEYYELVLLRCLEKNVLTFQRGVQKFKGMFRTNILCEAVESRYSNWKLQDHNMGGMSDEQKKAFGDTYGLLLRLSGRDDEAFKILLDVEQSDELFVLIREKGLFAKAMEILPDLFARNEDKTIELLLEHLNPTYSVFQKEDVTNAPPPWVIFAPAAVLQRLERTQRGYLWAYLKALQTCDKDAHAAVLKTHAQLVATLFIKNEPSGLLSFLRENAGNLPKLRDIYALCKKHQLLEEMVFLLARMGKEEEGLHIIVHDMKNMDKAVQFVADIPNSDDQLALYKKLVHMVLEVNALLPSQRGQKYFEHCVAEWETWASIARRYNVDEIELRKANSSRMAVTSGTGRLTPCGSSCIVPLNLVEALLKAVVDPSISGRAALDPTYIIQRMPEDEPVPRVGRCIATVARSKAHDMQLMKTIVHVVTTDLAKQYDKLYRSRTAAIRVDPGATICSFCHRLALAGIVIFSCSHAYHATCVIGCLEGEGVLLVQPTDIDVNGFFRYPKKYLSSDSWRTLLRCPICREAYGAVK